MASEPTSAREPPPHLQTSPEHGRNEGKVTEEGKPPRPSGRARQRKRKRNVQTEHVPEEKIYATPWVEALGTTVYESKQQRLHDEIVAYTNWILPTPEEDAARKRVIERVTEVVQRRFSKASISTFGSVAQGLYVPDGDIDLVMTLPQQLGDEDKKRILFQLAAALKSAHIAASTNVVHHARVPVIQFQTTPESGSYKIDISLNHEDGVKAVPVITDYIQRMPALRHLVMAMKGFLAQHNLNSAAYGGLSSYSLICLAISFLQLNPFSRDEEKVTKPLEKESLGTLLMDFFDYYANEFPYETSYISVLEGKLLPKEAKGWLKESRPYSLCIECLINPNNDIGKATSQLRRIREVFKMALETLDTHPFKEIPDNVLGSILGVPEETVAQREHVQELIRSGQLDEALNGVQMPPVWQRPTHQTQRRDPPPHFSHPGAAQASTRQIQERNLPSRPMWDSYRPRRREDDTTSSSRYGRQSRDSGYEDRPRSSRHDEHRRDPRRDERHRDSRRDDRHRDSRRDDRHRDSRRNDDRHRDARPDDRHRDSRYDDRSRDSSEEPRRKRHRD